MLKLNVICKIAVVILLFFANYFHAQSVKNPSKTTLENQNSEELIQCNYEKNLLVKENDDLKKSNSELISNIGNIVMLSTRGSENLEKSLEFLKEKDRKIERLKEALDRKDSITKSLIIQLQGQPSLSINYAFLEKKKNQILDNYVKIKINNFDKEMRPYEFKDARDFIIYDLDNDGVDELLAFYTLEAYGGGNNWEHYLAIFKGSNNKSKFIDEIVLFGDVYGHKYSSGELLKKDKNKLYFKVYNSGFGGGKEGYKEIFITFINNKLIME
jgi:hypothetical protein